MPFAKTDNSIAAMEGEGTRLLEPAEENWEDLALSSRAEKTLKEVARRSGAGKRIAALISGPVGPGKTRAASRVARDLNRQVLHVRLFCLGSDGPEATEKKLDRLFAAADPDKVVLLFDEAEALFAKRPEAAEGSECLSRVERYFLESVEGFPGLALLATHHCKRINPLLARRFHYAVKI